MINVIALTKYSKEGPSSRYRYYNYIDCLKQKGVNIIVKPLFKEGYFAQKNKLRKIFFVLNAYISRIFIIFSILFAKKYDLILIEYELLPYFPPIFEILLNKRGIKYIVDYDDAIFHKYDLNSNYLIKKFLSNKIPAVIKNATYVIACNCYLENFAKKYNKNIIKIPTVVLLDKYLKIMQKYKKSNKNFIIGWIGSKTTSKYILSILEVFKILKNRYDDIEVHLIGFDKTLLTNKECRDLNIKIYDWKEEEEIKRILEFDVGIMPLTDDKWSRGKCGFKLIQYMSCKKPVIANGVGINKKIVSKNTGFLVSSIDEWINSIEYFYKNRDKRELMGENSLKEVLKNYNHSKNCIKYENLFKNIKGL
jgi:glycosyltransferase involved in cell wall biosynthesis